MRKKGFSIIELLVVISVLVILIKIGLPRFKGMQDQGKVFQAQTELKKMKAAVVSYYLNSNPHAYPTNSTTVGFSYLSRSRPMIVSSTPPYDPFGDTVTSEYNYIKSANGYYFVIWSKGADGGGDVSAISSTGAVTKSGNAICTTNGSGC